jgi:hypothetical protein
MKSFLLGFFLILFSLSAGALFITAPLVVSPCQSGVSYDFNLSRPSFLSTDISFPHFLPSFLKSNGSLVFDVPCNASPGVYQFSLNSWNGYYNDTETTQVFVSSNSSGISVLNPSVSCVCSSSKSFIQGNGSVSVESPFQYWLSPDGSVLIQSVPCSTQAGLYLFKVFSNSKEYDYALNVVQCNNVVLKTPSLAQACTGVFSTTLTLSNNQNSENVFTLTSSIGNVLSPIDLAPFASRSFIYTYFFASPGVYPIQINVSGGSSGFNSQSNFAVNVSSCAPRFLNLTVSGVLLGNGKANVTITNNEVFDVTGAVFKLNGSIANAVAIPSQKSVTLTFPFNSSTAFISGFAAQGIFNQTLSLSSSTSLLSGFIIALPYAGGMLILIIIVIGFYFVSRRHDKTDDELFEDAKRSLEV